MADIKITDLAAYTDPVSTDVLPIVDVGSDLTKKVSIADLLENAGTGGATAPSFSFDGDNNTGIYRPGADQLAISTNGTGRLFVDSSGNVFIGGSTAATADIALNADGSVEFAVGRFAIGGGGKITQNVVAGSTGTIIDLKNDGTSVFQVLPSGYTKIGGNNIKLDASGKGEFANHVISGGDPTNGVSAGAKLDKDGTIRVARAAGSQKVWDGYIVGNSSATSAIYANGSAQFNGSVSIAGTLPSSPNISLNADGSAQFAGSIKTDGQTIYTTTSNPSLDREGSSNRAISGFYTEQPANNTGVVIASRLTSAEDPIGARLALNRYINSSTNVLDGDVLGEISASGGQGANASRNSSKIRMIVDGTPGNLVPGAIEFMTATSGVVPRTRARITSNGSVLIGGTLPSAPSISLQADGSAEFTGSVSIGGTVAANTIEKYESGSFTPTFVFDTGSITTYAAQQGYYTIIGNIVTINVYIATSNLNSPAGDVTIGGLPAPLSTTGNYPQFFGKGKIVATNMSSSNKAVYIIGSGDSNAGLLLFTDPDYLTRLQGSDLLSGNNKNQLRFSMSYRTD